MAQCDIDAVVRKRAGRALRPFDQRHRAFGQGRQTDLFQFRCFVDPVEIRMQQRKRWELVGLREGEGRARNLNRVVAGEIADHRARRCGLPGTEIAGQRDDIARADQQCEVGHQMGGCRLVCQRKRECGGNSHSAALRCAV